MTSPRCIINGCAFVDMAHAVAVWGDLWEVGDCYAFVGVVDGSRGLAWNRALPLEECKKCIFIGGQRGTFLERGHMIVAAKVHCTLNGLAQEYLRPIGREGA